MTPARLINWWRNSSRTNHTQVLLATEELEQRCVPAIYRWKPATPLDSRDWMPPQQDEVWQKLIRPDPALPAFWWYTSTPPGADGNGSQVGVVPKVLTPGEEAVAKVRAAGITDCDTALFELSKPGGYLPGGKRLRVDHKFGGDHSAYIGPDGMVYDPTGLGYVTKPQPGRPQGYWTEAKWRRRDYSMPPSAGCSPQPST